MEAGQGDELELVPLGPQLRLEMGDRRRVELLLPVEGGRAVVGQELAGELGVEGLGEAPRLLQIGLRGLAPNEIGERGKGQAAGDGAVEAAFQNVEALGGARLVAVDELVVPRVDV